MTATDEDTRRSFAIFDRFLDGPPDRAIGVGVSGGGDSVALLYALAQWGRRPLEVFCVDHGLNPASADWTRGVERHAAVVGAGFTALYWLGDKPATGLSARAREARHALLAQSAREKGITVLCLAHTADDIAEAGIMRAEGSTVGTPALWSPSPAWPEGRGVFLFRPFIGRRREALRDSLRAQDVTWIDDPANDNPASLRARARQKTGEWPVSQVVVPTNKIDVEALLDDPHGLSALGLLRFDVNVLTALPRDTAVKCLSAAVVCAGGGNRLPRRDAVQALLDDLTDGSVATLAGARVFTQGRLVHIVREAGDIDRHGSAATDLMPDQPVMWDGRFEIAAPFAARIVASGNDRARLSKADRGVLGSLPPVLRSVLPVMSSSGTDEGPVLALPALNASGQGHHDTVSCACWVLPRFFAAIGIWTRESDLLAGMKIRKQNRL